MYSRCFFTLPTSLNPFGESSGKDSGPEDDLQRYHERKIMPYSRKQLYELVANVDSYHRFIPFCTGSTVLKSSRPDWKTNLGNDGDPPVNLEAELKVGFLGVDESYVSKVECRPFESVQAVAATSTPIFKRLITTWRFQPASANSPHPTNVESRIDLSQHPAEEGPTLLSFDIAFAFSNPLHAAMSRGFFGRVSSMMVTAFEERCIEVYGKGKR